MTWAVLKKIRDCPHRERECTVSGHFWASCSWGGATLSASAETRAPPAGRVSVERFVVQGDNPLSETETAAALAPFLGASANLDRLQAATGALEAVLRGKGFAFHRVSLPPQVLEAGAVRLEIHAIPVARIAVQGNQHFSEANIRASLPMLQEGRSPNVLELSRTLALANSHPQKKTQVGFAAAAPGAVEATVTVEDRTPRQVYTFLNNTGSAETGRGRLGVGFQHGNLFDRDHTLGLSYTTSPEKSDKVAQYGASYTIPFYARGGSLNLLFVKSDVNTGTIGDFFNVSGAVTVYAARYAHFLTRRKEITQSFALGVEDKFYQNTVDFGGTPLGVDVRARPVTVSYSGSREGPAAKANWHLAIGRNLADGSHNDNATYNSSRAGADANWEVIRWGAGLDLPLASWTLRAAVEGQSAGEPLISGEQFGLGGASSVRGFEEREVAGDRGWRAVLELWSPPLAGNARLLGFVEGGETRRLQAQAAEVANEGVSSAGVGGRWQWREQLSVSADWGYVLNGVDASRTSGSKHGRNKLHFNLLYRF